MINIIRTDAVNPDFIYLVRLLNADLSIRDGEDHGFYMQYNKLESIKYVLVADENGEAVGCGAIREYAPGIMEVKRMFTHPDHRSKGIARKILSELEDWTRELKYEKCILETGIKQPEAIQVYQRSGYAITENYGQYKGVVNSVCFEKILQLLFFTVLFSCWGCQPPKENKVVPVIDSTTLTKPLPATDPMDSLAFFGNKYPAEVNLLNYDPLVLRLKKLVSDYWFEFLKSHAQVEEPIKIEKNIFLSAFCEAHNCGATNAIIVFDLLKKKLSVGIRENGRAKTWTEEATMPEQIQYWLNKP